jgi:hypothetical protein
MSLDGSHEIFHQYTDPCFASAFFFSLHFVFRICSRTQARCRAHQKCETFKVFRELLKGTFQTERFTSTQIFPVNVQQLKSKTKNRDVQSKRLDPYTCIVFFNIFLAFYPRCVGERTNN